MEQKDITGLLDKVKAGTATPAEAAAVKRWLHGLNEAGETGLSDEELTQGRVAMWQAIRSAQGARTRRLWPRVAAAASILIAIGTSIGFLLYERQVKQDQVAVVQKVDVLPGNQSAVLQLSNGQQISLTAAKAGKIAVQGNTSIHKTADNKLIYEAGAPATELVYNTVTTKRGNFYPLTLSDGTVAILDAGSSIKYPVAFVGKERRVEITGQVYFEVKHNAAMPFRVSVKGQTIEDLGTHFNINAYDDEPNIKATLIEGRIKIQDKTLIPGQQAIITNGNMVVKPANVEQAVAWKNGLFNFEQVPIAEAMRQLSRWYDVDVEYPQGMPPIVFSGKMHRNVNASQVLEILKFFKVKFELQSKKIIVKP